MSTFRGKVTLLSLGVLSSLNINSGQIYAADTNDSSAKTGTAKNQNGVEAMTNRAQQLSQERIDREKIEAERQARSQLVAEALTAVEQTQAAIKFIDEKNTQKAISTLENTLGKIDIVLARQPGLATVPVSAQVQVIDLMANDETVKNIAKQAKDLVNDGQYQAARKLLRDFASEIDIITVNIPLATFRPAIQNASTLLNEGKSLAAKSELLVALNSLLIVERTIPLGLVKTQAWIEDISRQVNENKVNRDQSNRLLNDAISQLKLTRDMGYAISDDEFNNLQSSIKQLQNDLNNKKENKGIISKIKNDLAALRDKILKKSTA